MHVFPALPEIPNGSVLGIHYNGHQDTAIAIVAPDGTPVFALALERVSGQQRDGNAPHALLKHIPWPRIRCIAVSADSKLLKPAPHEGQLLSVALTKERANGGRLRTGFHDYLANFPVNAVFVDHQLAHAASAFWGSGFDESVCFIYGGPTPNCPWFGGFYQASRLTGIRALEQFSGLRHANLTVLLAFVTALLGYTPCKHEGKLTGLAAHGKSTPECLEVLQRWFGQEFDQIESTMRWANAEWDTASGIHINKKRIQPYLQEISIFSPEDVAASLQSFAEMHISDILRNARQSGWENDSICLAGSLFSNVKINQRIAGAGFDRFYVAPAMTDDGSALGAAWYVQSALPGFNPSRQHSTYLGPSYSAEQCLQALLTHKIEFQQPENVASTIAQRLAEGKIVALFQGRMEFGPRALGNRSILAQASGPDVNQRLNNMLKRTEFMPFAPVSRMEDAAACYHDMDVLSQAAQTMTTTVNCTNSLKESCPSVVHIDGSARPCLVTPESNALLHSVLTQYQSMTGHAALINTSFNMHGQPIVCTPEDALRVMFEAGIDTLFLDGGYLVSLTIGAGSPATTARQNPHFPAIT